MYFVLRRRHGCALAHPVGVNLPSTALCAGVRQLPGADGLGADARSRGSGWSAGLGGVLEVVGGGGAELGVSGSADWVEGLLECYGFVDSVEANTGE